MMMMNRRSEPTDESCFSSSSSSSFNTFIHPKPLLNAVGDDHGISCATKSYRFIKPASTLGFFSRIWNYSTKSKSKGKKHDNCNNNTDTYMSSAAISSEFSRVPLPPQHFGKQNVNGQKKREDLETEVFVLENMLSHEEKIREILQQAYNRKPGSRLNLPNEIPPKLKELLTEVVMVEDEIVRLESQVQHLQKDVKFEQEATQIESKAKSSYSNYLRKNDDNNHNDNMILMQATRSNNGDHPQRNGYETNALHFINKTINRGNSSVDDFTINDKNIGNQGTTSTRSSSPYVQFPKESSGVQERQFKRSGILKPASSPLRDFRHPTPFKPKERNPEALRADRDLLKKSAIRESTIQLLGEEKSSSSRGTKLQANKLSENIMKSLILIYIRLIRTSRQMELEKSGPISRSMYSSMSFRTSEPGVNFSTSLVLHKESKQRDPYGVLDIEGSVTRDIGPYKNLVVFSSTCLDPKYVSHSSSIPLLQRLRGLLASLQKVDLRSMKEQQKLAFWINIYNACIMHGFLQFGLPSTPEKLLTLLNKATLNVGGKVVNAQAIERCILRKPTILPISKEGEKNCKEAIIHELYGLESMNPNIIFALCCGTRSSPAVRIYTAEGVISELEKSKLEYLQASILVTNSKKIGLPELLIQNKQDFTNKDVDDSLVEWICYQLPTSGSLRKSIVDSFKGLNNNNNNSGKMSSGANVEKLSYDFEFQYLLQV